MKKLISIISAALCFGAVYAQDAPAFPGAEGFGRYTQGGRGGVVKHVTNLNDDGPGSLRQAVKGTSKKIVVFDVSGIIELKSDLKIDANTTISGQTAPGQGITIRYYTVRPNGNNIVIRYIRCRRGSEVDKNNGADAIWCRQFTNLILDHCSVSWSIDELASFYDNRDFTMQWCALAEALDLGHDKGEHSYGGIWGGKGASFHHNFLAHMHNRAPRFNGARYGWEGYDKSLYPNTVQAERVDFRNCVIYNIGTGGCYGGPGGGYINMVNNYYKAGPGTKNKTRVTQVSILGSGGSGENQTLVGLTSRYYINGNYVTAANPPENYDWNGVIYESGITNQDYQRWMKDPNKMYPESDENRVNSAGVQSVPVKMNEEIAHGEVSTHSATEAYEMVLKYGGASLARDMVDVRNFEEANSGTATYTGSVHNYIGILDLVSDQGEYYLESSARPEGWDTDGDGIPNDWEIANGLDPNNAADGKTYTLDSRGWYTNVEVYINSIVEPLIKAQNETAETQVDEYFPTWVDPAGINDITTDNANQIRIEYFSLDGRRLENPATGITIRRTILSNGRVLTDKVVGMD